MAGILVREMWTLHLTKLERRPLSILPDTSEDSINVLPPLTEGDLRNTHLLLKEDGAYTSLLPVPLAFQEDF